MAFLPRRALNVGECEIARAYKVAGTNIEPIAFVVPRKVYPRSIPYAFRILTATFLYSRILSNLTFSPLRLRPSPR